ncbi:MAG: phosphate acyltransferase PlsX [Firmicutes bacterium]|nr:phosphate acyltransferase PlsX [Bacillota bacterium]
MRILVDAMGGDNAPEAIVSGSMDAINESEGFEIVLIGDAQKIEKLFKKRKFKNPRVMVINAGEVITNEDIPTKAIKHKKDSSMVVGFNMLKEKKGDVFISAGNTGALMTGALLILGRIQGVDRPALAPILPSRNGHVMLIDAGMNTVCKPINFVQFGIMGSIYMKEVFHMKTPRVGLINIGSEEVKGTDVIKQAYALAANSNINFVGNIEGREIMEGRVDVAVCDGFVGNVLLKFVEGVGPFIFDSLKEVYSKSLLSRLAGLLVKSGLREFRKKLDYKEQGGARILGVDGKVIKSHGSSDAKAIKNAIFRAAGYGKSYIVEQMRDEFKLWKTKLLTLNQCNSNI